MAMYTSLYASKTLTLRPEGPIHDAQLEGEKKIQKAVNRRTVDFTGPYLKLLQNHVSFRTFRDGATLCQLTAAGALDLLPPMSYTYQPVSSANTKFVHVSTNKNRCSINYVTWTPDGRRCMTGTQSGEFTLWNGTSYNFETILQAHEAPIRTMMFSHNEMWLLSGDDSGQLKYWKTNELVKAEQAHKESLRSVTFAPTDLKFATCSDDSIVKVWDFARCLTEASLTGHGGDVKSVDWHPVKSAVASGSKDGLVKIWDTKGKSCISTLHAHKSTVMTVKWNQNGNWLLTAARDQLCKVFDMRMHKELCVYKGHKRDVTCAAWHPIHEELFASGGYDGALMYWLVSRQVPQGEVRGAHEGSVWAMHWHPTGHVLVTGSGDFTTKFWCRARPGDPWRERGQKENEEGAETEGEAASGTAQQVPQVADAGQPSNSLLAGSGVIPGIGEAVLDIEALGGLDGVTNLPGLGRGIPPPRPPPGAPPPRPMSFFQPGPFGTWGPGPRPPPRGPFMERPWRGGRPGQPEPFFKRDHQQAFGDEGGGGPAGKIMRPVSLPGGPQPPGPWPPGGPPPAGLPGPRGPRPPPRPPPPRPGGGRPASAGPGDGPGGVGDIGQPRAPGMRPGMDPAAGGMFMGGPGPMGMPPGPFPGGGPGFGPGKQGWDGPPPPFNSGPGRGGRGGRGGGRGRS